MLLAKGHHDHLDDLESFFYLLCMLCLGYSGPGQAVVPTPSVFDGWELDRPSIAAGVKSSFVLQPQRRVEVSLDVSPSVKAVFSTAVTGLRAFVLKHYLAKRERVNAQQDAARVGQKGDPPAVVDGAFMAAADAEYAEFLGIIGGAIDALERAAPDSFGAPDDLGVTLSGRIGCGPSSVGVVPVQEMAAASGGGRKRASASEKNFEPARKRTRTDWP